MGREGAVDVGVAPGHGCGRQKMDQLQPLNVAGRGTRVGSLFVDGAEQLHRPLYASKRVLTFWGLPKGSAVEKVGGSGWSTGACLPDMQGLLTKYYSTHYTQ